MQAGLKTTIQYYMANSKKYRSIKRSGINTIRSEWDKRSIKRLAVRNIISYKEIKNRIKFRCYIQTHKSIFKYRLKC